MDESQKEKPARERSDGVNQGPLIKKRKKQKLFWHKPLALPKVELTSNNFYEQVEELISKVEITEKNLETRQEIMKDVWNTFNRVVPSVEAVGFGSSFNGTGFCNTDVDIFLKNKLAQGIVLKFGNLMYQNRKFNDIYVIRKARVPIIKATHIPSGLQVDISGSGCALDNTILLWSIYKSVKTFRNLTMLISYWAKLNSISGTNLITTYSFNLMIIFYLQSLELIPPLRELIELLSSRSGNQISKCFKNTVGIKQLLVGFFEFYSVRDFKKIISVLHGKDIEPEINQNFVIYIQDPIELQINTAKTVSYNLLQKFITLCKSNVEFFNSSPENLWLNKLIATPSTVEPFPIKCETHSPNWYENFKTDFKNVLEMLLFDVELVGEKFTLTSKYNTLCKAYRKLKNLYMIGALSAECYKNELQIATRDASYSPNFSCEIRLEKNDDGLVYLFISPKDEISKSDFFSVVSCLTAHIKPILNHYSNKLHT